LQQERFLFRVKAVGTAPERRLVPCVDEATKEQDYTAIPGNDLPKLTRLTEKHTRKGWIASLR